MLKQQLTELKDFILQYNTYFNEGYDNVYQDLVNGLILQDQKPIFPNDTLGNYFYLRLPEEMKFIYDDRRFNTDDCGFSFGIGAKVYLVACMRGAEPDLLLNNLVNTLQYFNGYISMSNAIYKKENVINQELKKFSKEDMAKALQNVGEDYAIVSVSFELSTNFTKLKLSCIERPCNGC